MTPLKPGLAVRIEEFVNGSKPFPLISIFSTGLAYRTLGLYNPSKASEAYIVLSDDHNEIWSSSTAMFALMPRCQKSEALYCLGVEP